VLDKIRIVQIAISIIMAVAGWIKKFKLHRKIKEGLEDLEDAEKKSKDRPDPGINAVYRVPTRLRDREDSDK